jgi:hypothetical protein
MADFEKKVTLITVDIDQEASFKKVDELTGAIIKQKTVIAENNTEIKALNKENADLSKQVAAGTISQDKAAKSIENNTKKVDDLRKKDINLKDGLSSLNAERKQAVKVSKLQANSLDALRAKVVKQKKELNGLNTATEKGKKRFEELSKSLKENNEIIKNSDQGAGDFKTTIGRYREETQKALQGTDAFTGGLASAGKGFLTLAKNALVFLATPVGLVIGALAGAIFAVKTAFESSEEGQNKFNKIMSVIGVTTGNLMDLVADFGEFIIEAFENPQKSIKDFSTLIKDNIVNRFDGLVQLIPQLGKAITQLFDGEFSAAAETAANAVGKVVLGVDDVTGKISDATSATIDFFDATVQESKLAAKVADDRAKADLIERKLLVERATLETEISRLKLKSRQEDKFGAEERRKALLDAQVLEDSLLKKEQEVLKLRSDAIALENTFSRSTKENLDAEAQAKADLISVESRRNDQQRSTQRELNRLNDEIAASDRKILNDKIKNQEKLDKKLTELADFKKEQDDERRLEEAESEEERYQLKLELEDERFEIEQERLAEKREIALENELLSMEERAAIIAEFDLSTEEARALHEDNLSKIQDKADKEEIKKLENKEKQKGKILKKAQELASKSSEAFFSFRENRVNKNASKELSTLENKLASGEITESEFARRKELLERNTAIKLYRIQLNQFRVNKALGLVQVGLDTAKSVSASSSVGYPQAIPMVALSVATGIAQGIAIAAQQPPPPPKFANGGVVSGFKVGGNLHSNGGTTYTGEDGNRFEVEKDEAIFVAKRGAADHALSYISNINESFGGSSFFDAPKHHLQDGGQVIDSGLTQDQISLIVQQTAAALPAPIAQIESIIGGIEADQSAKAIQIV